MSAASRERERQRAAKIENTHGCRESLVKWYDKSPEERKRIAEEKHQNPVDPIEDITPETAIPMEVMLAMQAKMMAQRKTK